MAQRIRFRLLADFSTKTPISGENVLKSVKYCLAFPEEWFGDRQPNFAFLSLVPIFNHSEDSI